MRRAPNGGLKVLVGHHSNDYNYVVLLIRESGYITVYREYAHEYTQLAHVHYPTPIETYRTFKVNGTATWSLRTPHPHRPDAPVRSRRLHHGRTCYQRNRTTGMSRQEAVRCLKRRLTGIGYRTQLWLGSRA